MTDQILICIGTKKGLFVAQGSKTRRRFELRGPIGGHFVWRHSDSGPLLLIAGGSGIAPLMSIVRHWAATVPDSPATLVYSVRTWDDLTFGDELLAIEAREPLLRIVATTTRGAKHRERDYERRLDALYAAQRAS